MTFPHPSEGSATPRATADPFVLPDGPVQIAFSGGRTSGMMLYRILQANGGLPERARIVFTNTGKEHPATLDFVRDCGDHWGVSIAWVEFRPGENGHRWSKVCYDTASRDGEPFEALFAMRGFLPNQHTRFCTAELKVRPARDYCRSIGWSRWTAAVGIRADEAHRIKPPSTKDRWSLWHPMANAGLSKHDVARFWAGRNFDLHLPIVGGKTPHGNCVGCFLKSERFLARLAVEDPAEYAWWEEMERKASYTATGKAGQWSESYSRRSLREFSERQGEMALSRDGHLCQADGGECSAYD